MPVVSCARSNRYLHHALISCGEIFRYRRGFGSNEVSGRCITHKLMFCAANLLVEHIHHNRCSQDVKGKTRLIEKKCERGWT